MEITKFLNNGKSFLQNRKSLYNDYKIGSSYDDERVIFYNNKRNDLSTINSECNGLILDRKTLMPLVLPSKSYNCTTLIKNILILRITMLF